MPQESCFKKSAGQSVEKTEPGGLVPGLQVTSWAAWSPELPPGHSLCTTRRTPLLSKRPSARKSCESGFSRSMKPCQQQHPRLAFGFLLGPKSFYARY